MPLSFTTSRRLMPKLLLICLLFPFGLRAQLLIPPASAPAVLRTHIGLTHFTLTYSRPSVNGRVIFGELIPYGEVWRTGANEATLLRFDQDIVIGEQAVPAGTYAIYTVPAAAAEWTFILSADTTLWGARGYDANKDVLRLSVPAQQLPERIETMEFRWLNLTHAHADLALEWEYTRLKIPVELGTHAEVQASIAQAGLLSDPAPKTAPKADDYYRAARYYLDNNLDLVQAKNWMDRRLLLGGEQFGVMRYQALLEHRLGHTAAAQRIMARSLELAAQAPNPHYVRMNTQTLREWARQPATLSGPDIVARSIAYHDPTQAWLQQAHTLHLYEGRPGGGYRITDLVLDEGNDTFAMTQRNAQDLIYRQLHADTCVLKLNGQTTFTAAEAKRHRLTCERTAFMRNYYSYLWGLPMKLQDPGTRIDDDAYLVDFFSESLLQVKVDYATEVGSDVWYFYFHPATYALRGYRFYHDEAANDGEYILLDGEAQVGPLRLPARRSWYTHGDRLFLGSDEILAE
jgi:hypothetical protein